MKKEWFVKTLTLGIVVLFFGAGVVSAFNVNLEDKSKPLNLGNWLYVGGNGTGNYTSIQDAINDSVDGDTVFVYDDSSPYYENIVIQKSIELIGENRETTIILGDESSDGVIVNISADNIIISGFTIQPHIGKPGGIFVNKNYASPDYWNIEVIQNITIFNNIITNTFWAGIFGIRLHYGNIYGNVIENCDGCGIILFISSNNTITNNVISDCSYRGIKIDGLWSPFRIKNYLYPKSENNIISYNTINSNRWGIGLYSGTINTTISYNNITNNHGVFPYHDGVGLVINQASKTHIVRNNFIDNYKNAYFNIINCFRYPQFLQNSWNNNYWGEPKDTPFRINGTLWFLPFARLPFGFSFPNFSLTEFELPWIAFDRHPAQEPYDIPIGI